MPHKKPVYVLALASILAIPQFSLPAPAAIVTWVTSSGGSWTDPTNWSSNPNLPGSGDDVSINGQAGDFLVSLTGSSQSINSLLTTERLSITNGTLTTATNFQFSNTLTLSNATLIGGTLIPGFGGAIGLNSSTFDGVTLASNLTITDTALTIKNNLTLAGAVISLNSVNSTSGIFASGPQSLLGTGTITLDGVEQSINTKLSASSTLTIGPGITIQTGSSGGILRTPLINQGTIVATGPRMLEIGLPLDPPFTNSGVLDVEAGATLRIDAATWNNPGGSLIMNGGQAGATLNFNGLLSTAGMNASNNSFTGTTNIVITGTIDNTSSIFNLPANLSFGVTFNGGTITGPGLSFKGTLNGVTIDHTTIAPTGSMTILNNLTLSSANISPPQLGNPSGLSISIPGAQTITGTGTLSFGFATSQHTISAGTLTLGSGIVVSLMPPGLTINADTFINNGKISPEAAFSGGSFIIGSASSTFINNGIIQITNNTTLINGAYDGSLGAIQMIGLNGVGPGNLVFAGTTTTPGLNLPAFQRVVGFVKVSGTLNNSGYVLPLNATTGSWTLTGTIIGGTVSGSDGATLLITNGTLDGVSLAASITVNNTNLTLKNSLNLANSNLVLNLNSAGSALLFSGLQSISGNGSLVLGGAIQSYQIANTSTLTLTPGITLRFTNQNLSLATPGLINQGLIPLDTAGKSFTINSASFDSSGTISGPGNITFVTGANNVSGTFSVTGTTTLNAGAALTFSSSAASAGRIIGGLGNLTVAPGASLISDGVLALSLSVSGTQTVRTSNATSGTSKIQSLLIANDSSNGYTGKFDLTASKLILETTGIPDKSAKIYQLTAALQSGSAAGAWTGKGLTSSTAANDPAHYGVALFDNALLQLPTFGGQPIDSNSLLVSIAHLGDANADGIIDIQDQSLITNNWQKPGTQWDNGDLNLDGFTDIQDLTIVTNNWQQQSAFSLISSFPDSLDSSPSPVPEPTTLALLLTPLFLAANRRRAHKTRPADQSCHKKNSA